ncbi:unnamed protein product [Protopolystoma xenopodis]|uniref:ABC transporter domain-containing protein n=1 Tax=Protopolystoma xenopodis TaxID=117903 RepID=A0A448X7Y0_9PLAT|nr:unnamed protein product [Protopolystoma xenopodis]
MYVEQEIVGDSTLAIDSVLSADVERHKLLQRLGYLQIQLHQDQNSPVNSSQNAEILDIYAKLQAIEADKAPARAARVLHGLGFTTEMQCQPTKEFSGGWRMRLALASGLFAKPDLLLLDEPTNMLDMRAIIWLEEYLKVHL